MGNGLIELHNFMPDDLEQLRKSLSDHCGLISSVSVHLAIFSTNYINKILSGEKSIESRMSHFRICPFEKVNSNDIVIMKESSGPILGAFSVHQAFSYIVSGVDEFVELKNKYSDAVCADESYWDFKSSAHYATFISISNPISLGPYYLKWRNRRGWIRFGSI